MLDPLALFNDTDFPVQIGKTPVAVNAELQARVLEGADPISCRPGDLLEPEVEQQFEKLTQIASDEGIRLADNVIDDVLTYALFPQIGIKFLQNRDNPDAFEPLPDASAAVTAPPVAGKGLAPSVYTVRVNGKSYTVEVAEGGQLSNVQPAAPAACF